MVSSKSYKPLPIHVENDDEVYDALLADKESAYFTWHTEAVVNGVSITMKKKTEILYKEGKLFFTGKKANIEVETKEVNHAQKSASQDTRQDVK